MKLPVVSEIPKVQVAALSDIHLAHQLTDKRHHLLFALLFDEHSTQYEPFNTANGINWANTLYARITSLINVCYVFVIDFGHGT